MIFVELNRIPTIKDFDETLEKISDGTDPPPKNSHLFLGRESGALKHKELEYVSGQHVFFSLLKKT